MRASAATGRPWRVASRAAGTLWLAAAAAARLGALRSRASSLERALVLRDGARKVLGLHGLEIVVEGSPPEGPALLAANHVSWLDPLVVASEVPCVPIFKADAARWPIVGRLAGGMGVIVLSRGDIRSGARVMREADDAFRRSLPVLNFPEGTTTDGSSVGAFRRGLFGVAGRAGVPIVPMALAYEPRASPGWATRPSSPTGSPWRLATAARPFCASAARSRPQRPGPPRLWLEPCGGESSTCSEAPVSQQSALEYISHGRTPFFRLRCIPRPQALPAGTRAVLLGVPFDGGTTYQPGARFAPCHVRRLSALVQGWHPVHRIAVFERVLAVDGGKVVFPPFHPPAMRERVQAEVAAITAAGAVPLVVGGDRSVALPVMRALAQAHGSLAVVHVDAHFDTSGPETWGESFHHGTPLRHALSEELVARGQLHQVGIRGPWGSAEDRDVGAAWEARLHPAEDIAERGIGAVMAEVRRAVGDLPLYLSIDVDAVDRPSPPGREPLPERPHVARGAEAGPSAGRGEARGHGRRRGVPRPRPRRYHLAPRSALLYEGLALLVLGKES